MTPSQRPKLYLVLPCYNEEAMLPLSAPILLQKLRDWKRAQRIHSASRLLFVDDGSKDGTWALLQALHSESPQEISCIQLSCNRGHQNALWAGMEAASHHADAIVSLDVDLQDDLQAVDTMLDALAGGYDVVYGVRQSRDTDSFLKRSTARLFYRIQERLGARIVYDHADFRLLSLRALQALLTHRESHLYVRGLVPLIGFPSTQVYYDRQARAAGESKYPLRAMLRLAANGLFDFSSRILGWILPFSLAGMLLTLLIGLGALVSRLAGQPFGPESHLAWLLIFCTSLLLLALGLMSQYLGRLSLEVKQRPRYFLSSVLHAPEKDDVPPTGAIASWHAEESCPASSSGKPQPQPSASAQEAN